MKKIDKYKYLSIQIYIKKIGSQKYFVLQFRINEHGTIDSEYERHRG